MSRPLACALALALVLGAPVALAEAPTGDVAAAQVLFDRALEDMSAGRHAAACPRLEEAHHLLPGALGIQEQLALCYEGLGRLATALQRWTTLERLAAGAGQTERQANAAQRATDARRRVAVLTLQVSAEAANTPGVLIQRDGEAVAPARWSAEIPVDRGAHEITVTAPGHMPVRQRVEVPSDGAKITVRIPALVPIAPRGEQAAQAGWQRPLGLAAIGVGAAGLAVGAVLGGLAIAKKDESDAGPCRAGNLCSQAGVDLRSEARSLGNGSTAMFIAGGVLAAGGVALVVLAPGSSPGSSTAVPSARLRLAVGSLALEGRF